MLNWFEQIIGAGDQTPLDKTELIQEKYRGIRPAPGYPANPDHTENQVYLNLKCYRINGRNLTESMAMIPAFGQWLVFAHPQAHYFGVGKIKEDQLNVLPWQGISWRA